MPSEPPKPKKPKPPDHFPADSVHGKWLRDRYEEVADRFDDRLGMKYVTDSIIPAYGKRFNIPGITRQSEAGQQIYQFCKNRHTHESRKKRMQAAKESAATAPTVVDPLKGKHRITARSVFHVEFADKINAAALARGPGIGVWRETHGAMYNSLGAVAHALYKAEAALQQEEAEENGGVTAANFDSVVDRVERAWQGTVKHSMHALPGSSYYGVLVAPDPTTGGEIVLRFEDTFPGGRTFSQFRTRDQRRADRKLLQSYAARQNLLYDEAMAKPPPEPELPPLDNKWSGPVIVGFLEAYLNAKYSVAHGPDAKIDWIRMVDHPGEFLPNGAWPEAVPVQPLPKMGLYPLVTLYNHFSMLEDEGRPIEFSLGGRQQGGSKVRQIKRSKPAASRKGKEKAVEPSPDTDESFDIDGSDDETDEDGSEDSAPSARYRISGASKRRGGAPVDQPGVNVAPVKVREERKTVRELHPELFTELDRFLDPRYVKKFLTEQRTQASSSKAPSKSVNTQGPLPTTKDAIRPAVGNVQQREPPRKRPELNGPVLEDGREDNLHDDADEGGQHGDHRRGRGQDKSGKSADEREQFNDAGLEPGRQEVQLNGPVLEGGREDDLPDDADEGGHHRDHRRKKGSDAFRESTDEREQFDDAALEDGREELLPNSDDEGGKRWRRRRAADHMWRPQLPASDLDDDDEPRYSDLKWRVGPAGSGIANSHSGSDSGERVEAPVLFSDEEPAPLATPPPQRRESDSSEDSARSVDSDGRNWAYPIWGSNESVSSQQESNKSVNSNQDSHDSDPKSPQSEANPSMGENTKSVTTSRGGVPFFDLRRRRPAPSLPKFIRPREESTGHDRSAVVKAAVAIVLSSGAADIAKPPVSAGHDHPLVVKAAVAIASSSRAAEIAKAPVSAGQDRPHVVKAKGHHVNPYDQTPSMKSLGRGFKWMPPYWQVVPNHITAREEVEGYNGPAWGAVSYFQSTVHVPAAGRLWRITVNLGAWLTLKLPAGHLPKPSFTKLEAENWTVLLQRIKAGKFDGPWLRETFSNWWTSLQPDTRRCDQCVEPCVSIDHLQHPAALPKAAWARMWVGGVVGVAVVLQYLGVSAGPGPINTWMVSEGEWFSWVYDVCWVFEQMRQWSMQDPAAPEVANVAAGAPQHIHKVAEAAGPVNKAPDAVRPAASKRRRAKTTVRDRSSSLSDISSSSPPSPKRRRASPSPPRKQGGLWKTGTYYETDSTPVKPLLDRSPVLSGVGRTRGSRKAQQVAAGGRVEDV